MTRELDGEVLVVDERLRLAPGRVLKSAVPGDRAGLWRQAKAFEVHAVLRDVRAAYQTIEVCLAGLLRLMVSTSGYRRWGTRSFEDYVTQDLRQPSLRRFQYLVAIDRAIVERGLSKLGEAWRKGSVSVAQARELIQVMTAGDQERWLQAADSMSVRALRREVRAALELGELPGGSEPAAANDDEEPWGVRCFAATRPVDEAWQVGLETSRRLAAYDLPVHESVDDFLAEYSSGCAVTPVNGPLPGLVVDPNDQTEAAAWRASARVAQEVWSQMQALRKIGRRARLAADPVQGLGDPPDPADLDRRIRWLLRLDGNVAWQEACLLELVASLRLFRYLGFSSLRQYVEEVLGSGYRAALAKISLARSLKRLPKVEDAFRRGRITALEAAQISRVACGFTQDAWIERARSSTLCQLEEEVRFVLDVGGDAQLPPKRPLPLSERPCARPVADSSWTGGSAGAAADRPRVQMCAPETSDVVATPLAQRAERWYSAYADGPRAVAERMLADSGPRRPVSFSAPAAIGAQWDLTIAHCRATLAGMAEGAEAASFSDSQCVSLLLLTFLGQWAHPRMIKKSRAFKVFTRDGWRCQVPGCRSRARLNAHHIVFRSRGGPDALWNLVTACRAHHAMIHAGVIRVRGRAPDLERAMGVNSRGEVRERYVNETRVGFNPEWTAQAEAPRTVQPSDWRAACEAVA